MIVEVSSEDADKRIQMLAQGASLVRLVNTVKGNRTFVLLAVYFADSTPPITEYLLYQDPNTSDSTVRHSLNQPHVIA